MNKIFKNSIIVLAGLMIGAMPVLALDLDLSVDEEIKKKYDTSKLKYDVLPALPKVDSTKSTTSQTPSKPTTNSTSTTTVNVPKSTPTYTVETPNVTKADLKNAIKIPAGTKFQVHSDQKISDWLRAGNTLGFTTYAPVYKSYISIPTGTKIYGKIEEVHRPQKTGNGGLVVIRITSIIYNGKSVSVNGKITKADSKHIYLNNIKGQHQYWKNVGKQIDKGEAFYKKTRQTSTKLANNPLGVIISPIPTIVGFVGYTGATILSPLTALTSTGGSLTIPAGSSFEVKLIENAYIN